MPPDVPPEFADAYLRGYARARAESATGSPTVNPTVSPTVKGTTDPGDAVDVPELPPSLTGFVIPEEGPALPAPRASVAPSADAARSRFPSPRPGPTVRRIAQVVQAQVVEAEVVEAEVVEARVVEPSVMPVVPAEAAPPRTRVVTEDVIVEAAPAPVEAADLVEVERPPRHEADEPFVPWAFEPPTDGAEDLPRRWQFEPPEEHTANVALEILEAEERVPGAGWSFEPPVLDLAEAGTDADVDADVDIDATLLIAQGALPLEDVEEAEPTAALPPLDDVVPGMRTYYRTDGAVYADGGSGRAAAAPPWMIPMMTLSLIAALFLAVYVLAR